MCLWVLFFSLRYNFLLWCAEVLLLFREMNLLLVPYWADRELDMIQWPPFLLASKVYLFEFFFFNFYLPLLSLNNPVSAFVDSNCIGYG